ncbi:MAG: type IX secretion system membrane protein PorP/SprF [Cytophagales bacterium]|nr:type IX secretion system membrane protein PorP/SprF [Bernardetiaceae bacterium]MDW8211492.1 type IX secretion system membrane protein PorP/SprF [Cytophagales bacterium]
MKKIALFVAFFGKATLLTWAQDANLTQFYASPLYLNPALTGATPYFRLSALYRNQWPQLPYAYHVNQFSADYNWDYYDSGVGILLLQDRIGSMAASDTRFSASYAYRARLHKNVVLRLGLQAGIGLRNTDWQRFVFEDQLKSGGATAESFAYPTILYPDLAVGALLHRADFWIGIAAFHLTRPSVGILHHAERLSRRFAIQAGYRIDLDPTEEEKITLSPALLYQRQANFEQVDLGVNLYYQPLLLGIWYRGMSLQHSAVAGVVGFRLKNALAISYSYDLALSQLHRLGGAHEMVLLYQPLDKRRKRGSKHVPCPVAF